MAFPAHGQEPPRVLEENRQGFLDVYEELWTKNLDIAKSILSLPFLQKMQKGTLSQKTFKDFVKQDIYYVGKVTSMLKKLSETPGEFQGFFKDRYDDYNQYLQSQLAEFKIKDFSDITPIPAIEKYIKDYREIMEKEKPIFFIVSMYPCERLWPFLAKQLKMDVKNPFYKWKEDNMHSMAEEYFKNVLNEHLQTKQEIEQANKIFRKQILNEKDFFEESSQNGKQ